MRLMKINTKDLTLSRATGSTTDRIGGSKPEYTQIGIVNGHLSALSDNYTVKNSGNHEGTRWSLIVLPDTDIRLSDHVTISGKEYTVTQLSEYSTHKTAVLEREGAL